MRAQKSYAAKSAVKSAERRYFSEIYHPLKILHSETLLTPTYI